MLVVGGFVAAALMLFVWSVRQGQLRDPEAAKHRMLELDRETGVRPDGE